MWGGGQGGGEPFARAGDRIQAAPPLDLGGLGFGVEGGCRVKGLRFRVEG